MLRREFLGLPLVLAGCKDYMRAVQTVFPAPGGGVAGPGQLVHGQSFTVSGFSGAGTKSRALAPLVRDVGAAATNTLDSQWTSGYANNATDNANFNLQNQLVGFSPTGAVIGSPNPYVSRIIAGGTGNTIQDANKGEDTGMQVNFTRPTGDYVLYSRICYRNDPNWTYGAFMSPQPGTLDDNLKIYSLNGAADGPYPGSNQYAYIAFEAQSIGWLPSTVYLSGDLGTLIYNSGNTYKLTQYGTTASSGGPTGTGTGIIDGTCKWDFVQVGVRTSQTMTTDAPHDSTAGFANPDANGHNIFWSASLYPGCASNGWIVQELEIYCTSSTTLAGGGRIDMFENANHNASLIGYRGYTDQMPGTVRAWLIGGYNRDYGSGAIKNYRYFADVTVDITGGGQSPGAHVAKVYVGDNANFLSCSKLEYQVSTAFADNSNTFTFWKGSLVGGAVGYIFIQPEQGAVIAAGSGQIQ